MRVILLVLISILYSQTAVSKDAFSFTSTSFGDSLIPQKKRGFSISTDLYGTFSSSIYKDYNPDARTWLGSMALFAQYNFGQWAIGGGGALEIQHYQILAFDLIGQTIRQSIGLATEYRYGKNRMFNYQCLGRLYYHFYKNKALSNQRTSIFQWEDYSLVVGWGPTVKMSRVQISPVLNFNWLSDNHFRTNSIRTRVIINLNFPLN